METGTKEGELSPEMDERTYNTYILRIEYTFLILLLFERRSFYL